MKSVILCGGRGTRMGEHGRSVPKALINIGGKPIIWHLLNVYLHYGIRDFVLCIGFLGDEIKRYFDEEPFTGGAITFADTGIDTNTGGRLKLVEEMLEGEEEFCVTYGDGLSNVDIGKLIAFHRGHGKIATVTAVHPHSNFGIMDVDDGGIITAFREKPLLKEWINGGFFVFNRRIFRFLGPDDVLEREPFEAMSREHQMMAYRHEGFWKCMDTFKDNMEFERLWKESPEWKVW